MGTPRIKIKETKTTYQYTILYCNNENRAEIISYKTEAFDKNPQVKCSSCECNHFMQVIGWEEETWKA